MKTRYKKLCDAIFIIIHEQTAIDLCSTISIISQYWMEKGF